MQSLSIIIPAFNEDGAITQVIEEVMCLHLPVRSQVIIVNDGSTDRTPQLLQEIKKRFPTIDILHHEHNLGKGAAIHTALGHATGEYVLIQDADREYSPADIPALVYAADQHHADVVYGSRNLQKNTFHYARYYYGGIVLTKITNRVLHQQLTDQSTGYKLIRRSVINQCRLQETGFGFCSEITAKLAAQGIRIFEVPIRYTPRTFAQGKKIRWLDGVRGVYCTWKYRRYSP